MVTAVSVIGQCGAVDSLFLQNANGDVRVDSVETLVCDNLEWRGEGGGRGWTPLRIVPSRLVVFLPHIRYLSLLAYL